MNSPLIFTHPGLYSSGPLHWQTIWEREHGFTRIEQLDWNTPVCDVWIDNIESKLDPARFDETILVGHSLACITIVKWHEKFGHRIRGALLVAPSDTEAPSYPQGTTGFTPLPLTRLPFPSIVVTSSNDYYVTRERAAAFADAWGSQLIIVGPLGHINAESGLGNWPEGLSILNQLKNLNNGHTTQTGR